MAYDVFIAHPGAQAEQARQLHTQLVQQGLTAFLDQTDIAPAEQWPQAIQAAQRASRLTVVLLCERMVTSPYLQHEIDLAIEMAREGAHHVAPVWLDGVPSRVADWPYGLSPFQGQGLDTAQGGWVGISHQLRAVLHPEQAPTVPVKPAGTRYDPTWYVAHEREDWALALLREGGEPISIVGPWKSGKTWLLNHLVQQLTADGLPTTAVHLDLDDLWHGSDDDPDQFWLLLAEEMCDAAGVGPDILRPEWKRRGAGSYKLGRLLRDRILPDTPAHGRLLLVIDNADALAGTTVNAPLYAALRGWTQRIGDPWDRLRLITATTTTPTRLVEDVSQSVFASAPVETGRWREPEVQRIATRTGLSAQAAQTIWTALDGQPFLTRTVLYDAVTRKLDVRQALAPNEPRFAGYLRGYAKRLRALGLLDHVRQLAQQPQRFERETELQLVDVGVAVQNDRMCRLRIPLFKHITDAA